MRKLLSFLLLFLLFFLRLQFLPKLDLKEGQKVRITGKINEEPQATGSVQKFKLGEIEIVTQRYPEFGYGKQVVAEGRIKVENCHPDRTAVSGGISCAYSLSFPKISLARGDPAARGGLARLDVRGWAIKLRQNLREVYKKVLISPFDGIVAGVILGDKTLIPRDFYENLKKTGTLHILVASGMNIALFSQGLLSFLCFFFKRKISVLLLILLIWFYSFITGMQAPIIRAAIMATLVYLGEFFGRQNEGERVLWLTGLIMVFVNPYLVNDIGFQLSFLATAGLVYIQPILKEKLNTICIIKNKSLMQFSEERKVKSEERNSKTKSFKLYALVFRFKFLALSLTKNDNFISSLSAQIATLPILFMAFGQYNLLSPVINLLILWTIPFVLQIGVFIGVLGLLGTIGLSLAKIASYPFIPLLFYLEQVINFTAKIDWFQVQVLRISAWWVVGYYFALVCWLRKKTVKIRNLKFEI